MKIKKGIKIRRRRNSTLQTLDQTVAPQSSRPMDWAETQENVYIAIFVTKCIYKKGPSSIFRHNKHSN
jgi:hypothetical protein